ncbi:MAG: hypothetical protein LIR46_12765 [Bacteroidota bacterium]|nr:hypothetical protein [Bacteroidota bacterium]
MDDISNKFYKEEAIMGIAKEENKVNIYGIGAPIDDIEDWKNFVKKYNEIAKEIKENSDTLSEEFEDECIPEFPCFLAIETFTLDEFIEMYENKNTNVKFEDIKKIFKLIDEYPLAIFRVC